MTELIDTTEAARKQVYRVVIEAPIHDVWNTLTTQGEPLPFFFDAVLHTTSLAPGAPIRMRTADGKYTGVVGEVLEIDPPHRYAHTMKFTALDEPICRVTYELRAIEGGTEFTLTTEGVVVDTKTAGYMATGGEFITRTLKGLIENGRPPLKSRMILMLCHLTAPLTPRRCRSEHWPFDRVIS